MPVINPQRQGLNLGVAEVSEQRQAVQLGQITPNVSKAKQQQLQAQAAGPQFLADFLQKTVGVVEQVKNQQTASKAKSDALQGSFDADAANSGWTGEIYRGTYSQSAMAADVGDYMATRDSKIQQDLASGTSYADAMKADQQRLNDLIGNVSKYQGAIGLKAHDAFLNQLGQVRTQQSNELAKHAAAQSLATADASLNALVAGGASTSMSALGVGDTGGFRAQRDSMFSSIDAADYLSPEQKMQKKQLYFVTMGQAAKSGAQLNSIMQEAQASLGVNSQAVMNNLEAQRGKATLGDRINLLNQLNADVSKLSPDQQVQTAENNRHLVQQMIQEGTLSPEQGESYMKAYRTQLDKAQMQSVTQSFLGQNGNLDAVAKATGKSAETLYNNATAGFDVPTKIALAQQFSANRDSTAFALAMKDLGKDVSNQLNLMASSSVDKLSDAQLASLQNLDAMKQTNPAMFDALLDGMGDEGAMLRSLAESGSISTSSLQGYQEKRRTAQALAGKDIGKKARDEIIADAAADVNSRFAANGSFAAGALNRNSWNEGALAQVSKDVLADLTNEQIQLGGKNLVAQRMGDRVLQVSLDTGSTKGISVGSVTSERGVSMQQTVQRLGLANKADLATLIADRYKALAQSVDGADVVAPRLMRDGSLQMTVVDSSTGESYPVTFSQAQMNEQAKSFMDSRNKKSDAYIQNEANMRPVSLGGETVLMRGNDFSVGSDTVKGNWVVSAASELAREEGFRSKVYQDTKGVDTWGIGMTEASGAQPHEVSTPQGAADKLQELIQGNYGKTAVQALQKANVPLDKSTFVMLTELAYQSPKSATEVANALGKYYAGTADANSVYSALGNSAGFQAGAESRQRARSNRLQHVLESLDQARRANRTNPLQAG